MKVDSPTVTYAYESDSYGGLHNPNVGCLHSVECPLDNGFARSLIGPNWFGGPASTSIHYLVGPDDICQGVPENRIAFHVGNANRGTIGVEQCGYARYSQAEWNTAKGRLQRTNVAKLMADINKRKPQIQLRYLSVSELRYALANPGSPGGWAWHDLCRQAVGGTTHHDPVVSAGALVNFPFQDLMNEAIAIRGGVVPPIIPPIEVDDDMQYVTLQPSAGPYKSAIWIAWPGVCEPLPSMEYYNILVGTGMAKAVKSVNEREFDVLKDAFRSWPSNHLVNETWNGNKSRIASKVVPGSFPTAAEMVAFTNEAAEDAKRLISEVKVILETPKA